MGRVRCFNWHFTERKALPEQDYRVLAQNLIALGLLRSDQGNSKEPEQIVRNALAITNTHEPSDGSLLEEANFALGKVLVGGGKNQEATAILNMVVSLQSAGGEQSSEPARTLNVLAQANRYGHCGGEAWQDASFRAPLSGSGTVHSRRL